VYTLVEYPAFYVYKRDLKKAIKQSDVICNSQYMAKKLKEIYGKDSCVQYPLIDISRLKSDFDSVNSITIKKRIVFIGDSVVKGLKIAKSLATLMPDVNFYFFSRLIREPIEESNIIWMPWQKQEVEVYKYARMVIVPSIWEEAYGRVSREAFLLNIPVLVSNIGGLPETVDGKQDYIVTDYLNPEAWKEKIENSL